MKFCPVCQARFEGNPAYCPEDGKALIEDLIDVTVDGKYKIKELKGYGSFGCVFLAEHLNLGGNVAVKVLLNSASADVRRRFQREAEAIKRLNGHPNIVFIYDFISTGDLVYLVQEYVDGRDLGAELKERASEGRRFIPLEALKVLAPIASALDTAHVQDIIHRDIKPENIMIARLDTPNPKVKLMDFGVAKFINRTDDEELRVTLTPRDRTVGTYYYMSPEQWGIAQRDQKVEIDHRADVYSLGVIAYQMISGRLPFQARTSQELYDQICSVTPALLHEFMPHVPEQFSNAISRAMAGDRADRQQSAGDFVSELAKTPGLPPLTGLAQEVWVLGTTRPEVEVPGLAETIKDLKRFRGEARSEAINLAVDMSDSLTSIYREGVGIVLSEPSIVLIDTATNTVRAAGRDAEDTPPDGVYELGRPIKEGKILDREMAQEMLKRFLVKVCDGTPDNLRIIVVMPAYQTVVERSALEDVVHRAKPLKDCEVYGANRVLCAAIGAGLRVKEIRGVMVINIEERVTDIAVISRGHIHSASQIRVGNAEFNEAIMQFISRCYRVSIDEPTAQMLKREIGSAFPLDETISIEVKGWDISEGLPKKITVADGDIGTVLGYTLSKIIDAVRLVLERMSLEVSGGIIESGIVLTGSGALLRNLKKRLSVEIGLPVSLAANPLEAVVVGASHLLTDPSLGLKEALPKPNNRELRYYRSKLALAVRSVTRLVSSDLAIDCGAASTSIYKRGLGIVVTEPSTVAINLTTNSIEAVGYAARVMQGRSPANIKLIQPFRNGVVADPVIAGEMIRRLIIKAQRGAHWLNPRLVMSVHSGLSKVERQAFVDAGYYAKASEVYLVQGEIAAAIGAGCAITEPSGTMLVDIGASTTKIAILSLSDIVYSSTLSVAGIEMDEAIRQYIKRKYNFLMGEGTEEVIKSELGSAFPLDDPLTIEVWGRALAEGIPKMITINDEEIREALSDPVSTIVYAVMRALDKAPSRLYRDIFQKGVVLSGGGALLKNFERRFSVEFRIPVMLSEDPQASLVIGAGKMLYDISRLKREALS